MLPGASGRVNYVTDLPCHSGTLGCGEQGMNHCPPKGCHNFECEPVSTLHPKIAVGKILLTVSEISLLYA